MAAVTVPTINGSVTEDRPFEPMRWEGSKLVDWGDPIPLDPRHGPEIPPHYIPESIRPYVEAVAASFQVPLGMPLTLVLGAISIAVGGKTEITIKDWREAVHGHFVVVADPGEMKSGVHREIHQTISEREAELNEMERPRVNEWESRNRELEQSLRRAEGATKKSSEDDRLALAGDRIAALDALERHTEQRVTYTTLTVDNSTPEAASALLFANGGVLGVCSAEGTFIESQLFGYKPQPDMELLLKGHAGDPMRTDRSTSAGGRTDRACLTLSICLQPQALQDAGKVKGFSGKGAPQRFLVCFPESMAGRRDVLNAPQIPAYLRDEWQANIRRLLDIPRGDKPEQLELSPGAAEVFRAFLVEHERSLRLLSGGFKGWVSKQRGAVLRLAGLFHLVESGLDQPISARTMASAVAMSWWFRQHAQIMFRLLADDASHSAAAEVLEWIQATGRDSLTAREVHRGLSGRARFRDAKLVREALEVLDLHNYIELMEDKGGVGRPSTLVFIHPKIHGQNRHNPKEQPMVDEWDQRFATFDLDAFLRQHAGSEVDRDEWDDDEPADDFDFSDDDFSVEDDED